MDEVASLDSPSQGGTTFAKATLAQRTSQIAED
jgi:hypothetical protein